MKKNQSKEKNDDDDDDDGGHTAAVEYDKLRMITIAIVLPERKSTGVYCSI